MYIFFILDYFVWAGAVGRITANNGFGVHKFSGFALRCSRCIMYFERWQKGGEEIGRGGGMADLNIVAAADERNEWPMMRR